MHAYLSLGMTSHTTAPFLPGGFLALDWCDGNAVGPLARRSFALHAELAATLGVDCGYRRVRTHSISVRQPGESAARRCKVVLATPAPPCSAATWPERQRSHGLSALLAWTVASTSRGAG